MTTTIQTDTMTPMKVYLAGPMRGIPELPAGMDVTINLPIQFTHMEIIP